MKYNIREIEELKEELEEVNKKLIELSKCNMIGVELNHKKFGKGKIISQNDFNIVIQFEKEQKQLELNKQKLTGEFEINPDGSTENDEITDVVDDV